MRKLILVSSDLYVRDFLSAGAFDAIEDEETFYVAGPEVSSDALKAKPTYIGSIEMPQWRRDAYGDVRRLLLTAYRYRSRTARAKLQQVPLLPRSIQKMEALPGVRQLKIRARLRATGRNPSLHAKLKEVRPDVVVVPSSGVDAVVTDAVRSARELGIPVLALMYNWDNLSSKAAFAYEPDFLGVGGHQAVEHAEQIHRIRRERVAVLGSPYIDLHFRHPPGSTSSPFEFPYVVFAGCYQPFDELRALELLEEAIGRSQLDLKVVYLPHPKRLARKRDDFVDESRFEHVMLEPRIRDAYIEDRAKSVGRRHPLPLDYYPALLESAEFVVCPLSTLMLEAAIFGRRVLVIAYHDGVHRTSPGVAIDYLHFSGVDRVQTFDVCREISGLAPLFVKLAAHRHPWTRPPKEQMDYWVYHDERPYADRLAALVERIGGESARPRDAALAGGAAQSTARLGERP
jgi:hypothetical protein